MDAIAPRPKVVTIREILRMVEAGEFRIPVFQRPYVWSAEQVASYLESLFANFPTGTLLWFRQPGNAEVVSYGLLALDAPPTPNAFWIMDGRQRIGALAAALVNHHRPGSPALLLAYDLHTGQVGGYPDADEPPTDRLPLGVIADENDFQAWLAYADESADEAAAVRERFLDQAIPVMEMPDGESAPEIFLRLNSGGVWLSQEQIDHARRAGSADDPAILLDTVGAHGFGDFPEQLMTKSATSILETMEPGADFLAAKAEVLKPLRAAVSWLTDEAAVPHLSVWRRDDLLPALVRFFYVNPRPSVRARILLRRWLWRAMGDPGGELPVEAISGQDSIDASRLLAFVASEAPEPRSYLAHVGELLALTTLGPLSLASGERLPVTGLLHYHGAQSFRDFHGAPVLSPQSDGNLERAVRSATPEVLASHALGRDMIASADEDGGKFTAWRHDLLATMLMTKAEQLAEWGASDRPGIDSLLVDDEEA